MGRVSFEIDDNVVYERVINISHVTLVLRFYLKVSEEGSFRSKAV